MKTRGMNMIKKLLGAVLLLPALAFAAEAVQLDKAPVSMDPASLQHGAKIFVNYCLNCHGASYLRYNRLKDIGLSEELIKDNLMFTADKTGEQMKIALQAADGKAWFGATPPDLTVIARARASEFGSGGDWLYTYLRSFYRDPERPTGWNNTIFPNVGMPHVLWEHQGDKTAHVTEQDDGHGNMVKHIELQQGKPGKLSAEEYDKTVADLVSFMVWMGEPVAQERQTIGIWVLVTLAVLFVLALMLKKEYWKDVH